MNCPVNVVGHGGACYQHSGLALINQLLFEFATEPPTMAGGNPPSKKLEFEVEFSGIRN